jgi:uncharacterized protein YhbP (UPF0306 family)
MGEQTRPDELRHRIEAFLAAHHVMSLATAGPEGPHAANLFYACNGLALIWISDPKTRHSRDVEAEARVAATIAPDYSNFAQIRGLQIHGLAQRVREEERNAHLALLENRYSFLRQSAQGPQKMRDAYTQAAVYRLDPQRIIMIDNTRGFGSKETLDLSADA